MVSRSPSLPATEHLRSVLWQRIDLPGIDQCALWRLAAGWRLAGTALVARDGVPVRAEYAVGRDAAWRDDVDLGVTPATNTLPIRRLGPAVGAKPEAMAAWVSFPALTAAPLWQRYTRLDERRYRYEGDGGFAAELLVDDLGLIVACEAVVPPPFGWRRVSG